LTAHAALWYLDEATMRATLTDRSIRALAVPSSGQVDYFDTKLPGFGLRVTARGVRSWVVLYRHHGRKRRLTLGTVPLLSLADARAKARDVLASVVKGEDPATEKRASREAATFADLASEYIEKHAKPKKRSWKEDERILRVYVPKSWLVAPASTITRRDVRDLVETLAKTAPIMANRVLACLRKVFNFGIKRELVIVNPCFQIERPSPERQRDRVLSADELRAVWKALDAEDADTAALFRLYLLTAQRGGELRTMERSELDLEAGWWTIPAEKAKNGLAHRVPLSAPAVAILRDLKERANGSPWLFPSTSRSGYRETVRKVMDRLRERSQVEFVPHDLRRTVATFLTSELKVPRLIVSKLLNHVEPGITKVYDRASYDTEKRQALDAWGRRLESIVTGSPRRR
jgi:integrase